MANTIENDLAMSKRLVKIGTVLSNQLRESIKAGKKLDYKHYFNLLDKVIAVTKAINTSVENDLYGLSFAEGNSNSVSIQLINAEVLRIAKQTNDVLSFLLSQIAKEYINSANKDYSGLLKRLNSVLSLLNSELKIYKDENYWLFNEGKKASKNIGEIKDEIGWKVPLLNRFVELLSSKIEKEKSINALVDRKNFLIKMAKALKSFNEDLIQYSGNSNTPGAYNYNKFINQLITKNFSEDNNSNYYETLLAENNSSDKKDLLNDRNFLHQVLLAIQKRENVSYKEALNIYRNGKK